MTQRIQYILSFVICKPKETNIDAKAWEEKIIWVIEFLTFFHLLNLKNVSERQMNISALKQAQPMLWTF